MNVVLDTNIFISGIFWKGDPHKIINMWREGKIQVIITTETVSELLRVLNDFKIKIASKAKDEWIDMIILNSVMVVPKEHFDIVTDKTDNKFIDAAISGGASYIITNDKHLLQIKKFRLVTMITSKEFVEKNLNNE